MDINMNEFRQQDNTPFFTVSKYKLSVMYLATMGLYAIYWFYKNWKLQQPYMEKNIMPVWRASFSIFFTHSLFKRIRSTAEQNNINLNYNNNIMATLFVALMVLSSLLNQVTGSQNINILGITGLVLFVAGLYPLVLVQVTINQINNDPHGVFNDSFSALNYTFIVLGAIMWFLMITGLLISF